MRKRFNISVLGSVFFALYFVFAASLVNANQPVVAITQAANEDQNGQEEATFSELSLDVIIPSYAFDFGAAVLLPFIPKVEFLAVESVFISLNISDFYHPFFEKVFEHIIAPNAP
jgi:hypothetical protein